MFHLNYYNAAGEDAHEHGPGEEPSKVLSENTPLLSHENREIPSLPPCGEDVRAEKVDPAVVSNFIPKMAYRWDAIGTQLGQNSLVMELRRIPYDAQGNLARVLEEAIRSGCLPNYGTLFNILRSDGVDLPNVASELCKAVVHKHQSQQDPELL